MTQENNRQEEEVLFEVEPEAAGMRLDVYLAAVTDESLSRTYLQKLMEQGMVFVNGTAQGLKKQKVRPGDRILLRFPPPRPVKAQPEPIPLAVVYEDEAVIVVNKPKGMVVHPAPGNESGTLVNALLYHCRDLSSIGGVIRPGIVHRIDKNTSGLLMAAKNDKAHLSLAAQLKAHSITRVYEALVYDNLKEDRGTIDQPLGRDPENRLRMAVLAQKGKRAVTHWEVLERFGRFTRIQAGNGKDPSDPGPYGLYPPSLNGRYGLWTEKACYGYIHSDAACQDLGLYSSCNGKIYGVSRAAAGGIRKNAESFAGQSVRKIFGMPVWG